MELSVIISARNEFPMIVPTIHSILDNLKSFLDFHDYEVIIVNNCSDDSDPEKRGAGGTVDFLASRGMHNTGILRVMHYPFASNVGARNFGAKHARGKYVIFSDAHMFFEHGSLQRMLQTMKETDALVHPSVSWMGAFPAQPGYQYSWKLGEEFKGTWNNYRVGDGKDWFYVPAMGHCCLGARREKFLEYGGYIENRCYGGGEMYLDTLFWLMGSASITEPRSITYHLSASRGYSYHHDDYIYNIFACAYTLGADWWLERIYLNYLRKSKKEVLDRMLTEAKESSEKQRAHVAKNQVIPFNDLIASMPWDVKNKEKFGKSNSGFLVFHDTWLDLIKGTEVEKLYNESAGQKELNKFINEKLNNYVYKRQRNSQEAGSAIEEN